MNAEKLRQLRVWRDGQARKEGVEAYRVLSNQSLEEIVEREINTEEDLLSVKGIKEKKGAKYGREILAIMNEEVEKDKIPACAGMKQYDSKPKTLNSRTGDLGQASDEIIRLAEEGGEKIFSVSVFLDLVNVALRTFAVKIRGEVSGLSVRGGNYYFDLKDQTDGSVLSCIVWKNFYLMFGLELRDGLEIVVGGFPGMYKPSGRLSFRVNSLELVGEGVLKQQYELLRSKLEKEGLFDPNRKKSLPFFVEKIGLITSREGEAIHDVLNNLGRYGFNIKFIDSRVEGAQAVPGLLRAVRYFRDKDIDVLVITRGGGSLESLLSFNNEMLVRELANFPKPVISGIGHEKDVSLVDLVADKACSTPTGVAKLLNFNWDQAESKLLLFEKQIFDRYRRGLSSRISSLERISVSIKDGFKTILVSFRDLSRRLASSLADLGHKLSLNQNEIKRASLGLINTYSKLMTESSRQLASFEKAILWNDPRRQLRLGFSLTYSKNKMVRRPEEVSHGDEIEVQLASGKIYSKVTKITENGQ